MISPPARALMDVHCTHLLDTQESARYIMRLAEEDSQLAAYLGVLYLHQNLHTVLYIAGATAEATRATRGRYLMLGGH